jgi:hypothetical protein
MNLWMKIFEDAHRIEKERSRHHTFVNTLHFTEWNQLDIPTAQAPTNVSAYEKRLIIFNIFFFWGYIRNNIYERTYNN